MHYGGSESLRNLHTEAYNEYKTTVYFLGKNQTYLDAKTYNSAVKLNFEIGKKFTEFDTYIRQVKLIEEGKTTSYNPETANREIPAETESILNKFDDFVNLIKEKEKFKIID